MPRFVASMTPIGLMVLGAGIGYSQNYPNKPIRMVTGGAGGGSDFTARLIAQGISEPLGQPVIVENRASGMIAIEIVARAQPDGYTLLLFGSTFWILPLIQKMDYDPIKDFAPVTLTNSAPNILVVHPSVPVNNVKELIALAKAKPGELNLASGSPGGSTTLAGELFKSMAGVNMISIPYKSAAPARTDLLSGRVQVSFPTASGVIPLIKSGKVRALAVTTAKPSVLMPGLPTIAASGLPGYESGTATGIFTAVKTPRTIINRLNQDSVKFLNRPDTKELFLNAGLEIVASSPEEFAAAIRSETNRLAKLIKEAGIRAE